MDDRIHREDSETPPNNDWLSRLERSNRRTLLLGVQDNLIEWAATAASGYQGPTERYIEIFDRIPEDRDQLRGDIIRNAHRLMVMPAGVNAVLPALYTAMLCASSRVRASAASVVGKLDRRSREDVPELLYEAFAALLSDPYVIVHHAAVEALDHIALNAKLDERAKAAVAGWIDSYAASRKDDRFLLQCIELYLGRYTSDTQKRGNLGRLFVSLLERMRPDVLVERLSWFRRQLYETDGFAGVVVRCLANPDVTQYRKEDILRTLNYLPTSAIRAHRGELEAIAVAHNTERKVSANLVETLTRAGAWEEAARINDALYARIPNTIESRAQKLAANLHRIAARYEESIALGNTGALPELAVEWRATESQMEEHRNTYAQRRGPFAGFSSSD